MRKILLLLAILTAVFLSGCDQQILTGTQGSTPDDKWANDNQQTQKPEPEPQTDPRKWTFIVYMAADNDLEAAAIADFNELEAVDYSGAPISILVLLDRSPGYDMTNGNWSDTRLFEIKSDPNGLTSTIVYMAADNDLEAAAIADFNELEAVDYSGAPISILVLLDRSPGYDMTNGNWSDTRLFEIKSDPNGLTSTIVSPRIDCLELGLSADIETELNTADSFVLSRLIDFAKREYPAEYYALFMWGHGTGWRGAFNTDALPEPLKAVAIDDTHGQYMSLPAFGRAIAGKGLSVIGFDTCYGAILEVAYQIRNDAKLFVGSEGQIMSTGWDYTALFSSFIGKQELSIAELGNSIEKQFSAQYSGLSNATISQINLSAVGDLFHQFNNFSGALADAIDTVEAKNAVLKQILHDTESYYFTSFPSDLYIDIFDFSKKISALDNITQDASKQEAITASARELENSLSSAIPSSWAMNGTTKKLGVHVIPLYGIAVPAASHELAYVRGSMAIDKSAFVENSRHWVPNLIPKSDSLLDKLFYWTF